jgi:hypothetical protein
MSIVFNWSISKIQVIPAQDDKTNIVTRVEWLVKAVDEVNKVASSASGSRSFKLGSNFIPYEELTEAQVLGWCFEPETDVFTNSDGEEVTIVRNLKTEAEAQATDRIISQLAQKAAEPQLPWKTNAKQGA